jgi:hypothetical protein
MRSLTRVPKTIDGETVMEVEVVTTARTNEERMIEARQEFIL